MSAQSVTIEGTEYPNPSTAQRLIARLDADHYPAGGHEYRAQVINREVLPVDKALAGVDLDESDISLLVWLIKSDAAAEVVDLIAKVRTARRG